MKWKKIVKESVDERTFKKLLKQNGITKLPSGMSSRRDGLLEWRKERGYAGEKTIDRMRQQAEAAGWKRGREMDDAHPDGSWVASGDVYVSPDGQIEMSYYSYYGATSYDNSFSITFKMVGTGVNESEELDDWNDDEPKVYKYYSDEPISPKQFVSLVRSMEQSIEDIFIQNSDFYENADDPWEEFVNDMCQGKSPEEAFELDYYMNKPARDQLPDDIAKYVYANDFDAMQWLRGIFERLMPICKDQVDESSRFGFNVGDMVELTKDKSNTFTGETVKAGTQGEVVAVDKPMPGVIKVGIEGGKVISVPERQLKKVGEDEEPWKKLKAPEQPKRDIRPERPEDYYMRPTSYGSPRYTGD